mmetsp:Transcript_120833/g.376311  ORF Transcript_120833/g.376311 Transcript_120833/m.376311 type:complete len:318 (-) Transcript_120833:12-965(-)
MPSPSKILSYSSGSWRLRNRSLRSSELSAAGLDRLALFSSSLSSLICASSPLMTCCEVSDLALDLPEPAERAERGVCRSFSSFNFRIWAFKSSITRWDVSERMDRSDLAEGGLLLSSLSFWICTCRSSMMACEVADLSDLTEGALLQSGLSRSPRMRWLVSGGLLRALPEELAAAISRPGTPSFPERLSPPQFQPDALESWDGDGLSSAMVSSGCPGQGQCEGSPTLSGCSGSTATSLADAWSLRCFAWDGANCKKTTPKTGTPRNIQCTAIASNTPASANTASAPNVGPRPAGAASWSPAIRAALAWQGGFSAALA